MGNFGYISLIWDTVFTLSIHIRSLHLISSTSPFYYLIVCKFAGRMANSVDPDQTPCSAASDLGLHCLLRPVSINA